MESTQALGDLKRTHSPSKTFTYFAVFVFILFTAITGFIYFKAVIPVQEGTMNFSGDISIMYWVMAFIMIMALVILITAVSLSKGNTYYLYENGIVTEDKIGKKTQLFEDIQDLYLFSSGRTFVTNNIAFRNREENRWEVITPRYTKELKAIEFITQQHQLINVPEYLKRLEAGGNVTFQYISYNDAASKKLFALGTKSFLKVKPKDIVVYNDHLLIDNKNIMIADLSRFSTNNLMSKISLFDKDNKEVFSTATNGVFSGQTFITLLDKLVTQHPGSLS